MAAGETLPLAVLLNQPFADWEVGFLAASAQDFFGTNVLYYSPDGLPVKSEGGLHVTPSGSYDDIKPEKASAVIVCGSGAWEDPNGKDIASLLKRTVDGGTLLGVICAGTLTAARAGLFDTRKHTSNGFDWLKERAPDYKGAKLYQDANDAVFDRGVVSAPASAPASFARTVLQQLYPSHQALEQATAMLSRAR